jgi:hypothetical protein
MGWKNFIVADELTKRQLRGESLEDEDESLTVVLVMFRANALKTTVDR